MNLKYDPGPLAEPEPQKFGGLIVEYSCFSPNGSIAWIGKDGVLGVSNFRSEREKLYRLFGLTTVAAPAGTTKMVLSVDDYNALMKELAARQA